MSEKFKVIQVPFGSVFLDEENPRFPPLEGEPEVIKHLNASEKVYEVARDIVKLGGLNPLERIGVIKDEGSNTHVVVEGNRRVCALKLLLDPDRAPTPSMVKKFETLSKQWTAPDEIEVVWFMDRKIARPWVARLHSGEMNGVGRRDWNSEQQDRFSGPDHKKYPIAQSFLDHAQKKKWLKGEERPKLLSTIDRYVTKPFFREAVGLHVNDDKSIKKKPEADPAVVEQIWERFVRDSVEDMSLPVAQRRVSSRSNQPEIESYATELVKRVTGTSPQHNSVNAGTPDQSSDGQPSAGSGQPKDDSDAGDDKNAGATSKAAGRRRKPNPPKVREYLHNDPEVKKRLKALGCFKLESLHHSICTIPVTKHEVLSYISVWCFMECLVRYWTGEDAPFPTKLNPNKLQNWGGIPSKRCREIYRSLERILHHGNTNKHDGVSATYDIKQLHNDWELIQDVIALVLDECIQQK